MEDIYKNLSVSNKAACHTWIGIVTDAHGVVVYFEGLVDLEFTLLNLSISSRFSAKSPESKFTIIIVANGIASSIFILFYLFAFNI